jgi:hypothetical protein
MWKRVWISSIWRRMATKSTVKPLRKFKYQQAIRLLFLLCGLLMVACRPNEQPVNGGALTPLPTLTLIAIPPTQTPVPPTETPIPPPLPSLISPADLVTPVRQDQKSILTRLILDDLGVTQPDVILINERQWRSAETLDCERGVGETSRSGRVAGYEVILQSADKVYIYHTDQEAHFQLCQEINLADLPAEVLILIDPLAGELAHIAHRDLSQRLNVHQNRIQLVDMTLQVWEDSSLGCPRDDQTYVPMNINGYLITFHAGSAHYRYHTDSDRILPCFDVQPVN